MGAVLSNATKNVVDSSLFLPKTSTTTKMGTFMSAAQRHGQNPLPNKTKKIVGGVVGGVGGALAVGLLAGFLGAKTTTTMIITVTPSEQFIERTTPNLRSAAPWVSLVSNETLSPASMNVSIHETNASMSPAMFAMIGNDAEGWWWWIAIITIFCCTVCITAIMLLVITRRGSQPMMKKWRRMNRALTSKVYSPMSPSSSPMSMSSPSSCCSETSMLEPDSDINLGKELATSTPALAWVRRTPAVGLPPIIAAPPRQVPFVRSNTVVMGTPPLVVVQESHSTTTHRIAVPAFMPSSVTRPVPLQ